MAALAARKRISCKANLGSVQYASSIPLEAAAAAMRANDGFATSLKLSRAERLCDYGFNSALNCCDGLVHKCVIVGSSLTPELSGGGPVSRESTEAQSRRPLE